MSRTSIAVVGGGILGSAIAHEIHRRSTRAEVTLLDRDELGSGASGRSAGLHVPAGATARIRDMAAYSENYYARLAEQYPRLPVRPVEMAVVGARSDAQRLATWALEGRLSRAHDESDDPRPGCRGALAGGLVRVPAGCDVWNLEGCHYADVRALARILARELSPGVAVRESVRVDGIDAGAGGVVLRLGTGETLTVDRAVLAAGPWLNAPAWSALLAPLGVRVKKVVALHIERRPAAADPAVFFPQDDAFLLPLAHRGHWLFSYTCREWDVDPDDLHAGLSARDAEQAGAVLRRYVPDPAARRGTSGTAAVSGRVFCDAYSADGEPLVRALDGAGRIVFAGAANGSGYRLAPALAAATADLLHIPASRRSNG